MFSVINIVSVVIVVVLLGRDACANIAASKFDVGYGQELNYPFNGGTRVSYEQNIMRIHASPWLRAGRYGGLFEEYSDGHAIGRGLFELTKIDNIGNYNEWYFTERVALIRSSSSGAFTCVSAVPLIYSDETREFSVSMNISVDSYRETQFGGNCPSSDDVPKCETILSGRTWFACLSSSRSVVFWGGDSFASTSNGNWDSRSFSSNIVKSMATADYLFILLNDGTLHILGTKGRKFTKSDIVQVFATEYYWVLQARSGKVSVWEAGTVSTTDIIEQKSISGQVTEMVSTDVNGIYLVDTGTASTFGSIAGAAQLSGVARVYAGVSTPCVYALMKSDSSVQVICADTMYDEDTQVPSSFTKYLETHRFEKVVGCTGGYDVAIEKSGSIYLLSIRGDRDRDESESDRDSVIQSLKLSNSATYNVDQTSGACLVTAVDEAGNVKYAAGVPPSVGLPGLFSEDALDEVISFNQVHNLGYRFISKNTAYPTAMPTPSPTLRPTLPFMQSNITTDILDLYATYFIGDENKVAGISVVEAFMLVFSIIFASFIVIKRNLL